MAVTEVQTKDVEPSGTGSVSLDFDSSVATGNSVVVWICDYNTSGSVISTSEPTYDGSSVTGATKLIEIQNDVSDGSNNIMYFAIWLLPNVQSSGTSVDFTITNAFNDTNSRAYVMEVGGLGTSPSIDSATPNPATATGAAGGTTSSGATGNAAGSSGIVLGGMMQDGENSGYHPPSGWTTLAPTGGSSYGVASYEIFTSSGANYTWSSDPAAGQWATGAVILDASSSGSDAAVSPTVVAVTTAIPTPTIVANSSATVTPAVVGASTTIPSPSITASRSVDITPTAIAASTTIPSATVSSDLTVTFNSTSGGIDTYDVDSPLNNTDSAGTQQMRVLVPDSPSSLYPHAFLFMLPVESGQGTTYGDPLATMQGLDAQNTYNLTCVQPGYPVDPWYADKPSDSATSQESFTVALVEWAKANLDITGNEPIYLIGFSKSGIGGQDLQFRHPDLFAATASWDAPFAMTDYDGTDPNGTVGGSPDFIYGTSANFQDNYELSSTNLAAWRDASNFATVNRIWIGGFSSFEADVSDYDTALTSVGILHTNTWSSSESHAWHSDWVADALSDIIAPADATVTPNALAATVSIPTPTISAGAGITPSAIAVTATIPSPGLSTGAGVTPSVIDATTNIPSITFSSSVDVAAQRGIG